MAAGEIFALSVQLVTAEEWKMVCRWAGCKLVVAGHSSLPRADCVNLSAVPQSIALLKRIFEDGYAGTRLLSQSTSDFTYTVQVTLHRMRIEGDKISRKKSLDIKIATIVGPHPEEPRKRRLEG